MDTLLSPVSPGCEWCRLERAKSNEGTICTEDVSAVEFPTLLPFSDCSASICQSPRSTRRVALAQDGVKSQGYWQNFQQGRQEA